jgi:hypothetical protein
MSFILLTLFAFVFSAPGDEYGHAEPIENAQLIPTGKKLNATGWVSYKQCDSRWGSNQLGTCSQTICTAGCAMSRYAFFLSPFLLSHFLDVSLILFLVLKLTVSVAMMLRTKGVNIDPRTLNQWLKSNGGYANGCDIYWGKIDAFGYAVLCHCFVLGFFLSFIIIYSLFLFFAFIFLLFFSFFLSEFLFLIPHSHA